MISEDYLIKKEGYGYARDWANILIESNTLDKINLIYHYAPEKIDDRLQKLINQADGVFWSIVSKPELLELGLKEKSLNKVWVTGTKYFGPNSGLFYNSPKENFCFQRIQFDSKYREINKKLDEEWTDRFIDLTELIIDEEGTLPVFTSDCKFISQDGKHLTKFGAQYLSSLYLPEIDQIFNKMESNIGVK